MTGADITGDSQAKTTWGVVHLSRPRAVGGPASCVIRCGTTPWAEAITGAGLTFPKRAASVLAHAGRPVPPCVGEMPPGPLSRPKA
jgi:hypothetical protein